MAHSAGRSSLLPTPAPTAEGERIPAGADPEKRRRILEAAIRTFGRRGFHEARISEIASAAKVAEGTVYLYFKNKEDVLGVIFDESMDGVLAKARGIRGSGASAAERLASLVDLHLTFLASDRDLASVFQIELRRSARFVERFSRSKLVEYFRELGNVLRDGIASGEFRKDLDPKLAVRVLFGAADEILSEWLLSGEMTPAFDGRQMVHTLLRGFAANTEEERNTALKKGNDQGRGTVSSKGGNSPAAGRSAAPRANGAGSGAARLSSSSKQGSLSSPSSSLSRRKPS